MSDGDALRQLPSEESYLVRNFTGVILDSSDPFVVSNISRSDLDAAEAGARVVCAHLL